MSNAHDMWHKPYTWYPQLNGAVNPTCPWLEDKPQKTTSHRRRRHRQSHGVSVRQKTPTTNKSLTFLSLFFFFFFNACECAFVCGYLRPPWRLCCRQIRSWVGTILTGAATCSTWVPLLTDFTRGDAGTTWVGGVVRVKSVVVKSEMTAGLFAGAAALMVLQAAAACGTEHWVLTTILGESFVRGKGGTLRVGVLFVIKLLLNNVFLFYSLAAICSVYFSDK